MRESVGKRCLALLLAAVMLAGTGAGDRNAGLSQVAAADSQIQEKVEDAADTGGEVSDMDTAMPDSTGIAEETAGADTVIPDTEEIEQTDSDIDAGTENTDTGMENTDTGIENTDTEPPLQEELHETVVYADGALAINVASATIETEDTLQLYLSQDGTRVEADAWASSDTSVAKVDNTGLVTGSKAGSAVITGIYDGGSAECLISVVKKSMSTTTRYNVLAIDTSNSIKGTPLKREQEAAKRFCKKVLESEGNNYLAVVTYNDDAIVVCPMTDNYAELVKAIDNVTVKKNTNMEEALVKAGEILDQMPNGKNIMKNIVVCSDGLPYQGKSSTSGRYTAKDHRHYMYANPAYAASKKLKDKKYFVYGLGFFHNSEGKDLSFGKIFMKDIASKDKYYIVNNTNDIDDVFDDIADKITKTAINKKNVTLNTGQKDDLYVTVNGVATSAKWKSSNTSVVTVNSNGRITAKKAGTATITATVGNKKVTCKVKVVSLVLSKRSVKVYPGTSETIKATVKGINKKVSWKSENPKIATVKKGKITGKKVGSTVVTMSVGGFTKECKVQVLKPTIKLNKSKLTIYLKKSKTLKATVKGKSKKVKWKSSKPVVATVKNGKVTAKRDGTAVITASCNGVKATCKVKVVRKHPGNSHYFVVKPILTKYGNKKVDEYGTRLIVNKGAKVKKCAIYMEYKYNSGLRQRIPYYTVACVGKNITSARFEPYFGYKGKVIYSPANTNGQINSFSMYKNYDGIWTHSNYSLIAKNLTDRNGKSPTTYATGTAGKNMKLFTDKQKMIEWLKK